MAADPYVVAQAVAQVEQGFAAFALRANAKVPITEHGFKNATTNPDWIRTQLQAPSAGNYGITWPTDRERRVVVFDLDNGSDGRERPWGDRLLELIERIGPLPRTKATTTPSGGRHAFYGWPADVPIPPGDELFGFTVRWPGRGYLVGPGSSIDGRPYVAGDMTDIVDLPDTWVQAALAAHPPRRQRHDSGVITVTGTFTLPDHIPSGRRYATVRDYVASRYNAGLSEDELWALVLSEVAPRFAVPKDEQELRGDFERVVAKIGERLGPPARAASPQAAVAAVTPLQVAPLTAFTSTPIEWLWPGWLAKGVVTILDGNPGVSKSTLMADLVARVTTGREWPDGSPGTVPGRVLWITTEDDPGRVLRPRIEAAGGDASKVLFATSEVVFPDVAEMFNELVVQLSQEPEGLVLALIDPLFSHIDAKVRSIADADMRRNVMNPLQRAAEAADVGIIVVRHFNKDVTASTLNRGAGSLGGIVGAARAVWTATVDKEDPSGETKVVGVTKLNYAKAPMPQRYRVESRTPPGWVGDATVPVIEWLGEATMTIDQLNSQDEFAGDAREALEEILGPGSMNATSVANLMKNRGFGRDATRRAAARLGIVKAKTGIDGGWRWSLPEEQTALFEESATPFEESAPDPSKSAVPDSSKSAVPDGTPDLAHAGAGAGARTPLEHDSSDSSKSAVPDPSKSAVVDQPPDSSKDPKSVVAGAPPAPAPAREEPPPVVDAAAAIIDHVCRDYTAHRFDGHARTSAGPWSCRICYPEDF